MPVESQSFSGVKTVASGSSTTTLGTVFGSAKPLFLPDLSSVTPALLAHSAPERVVGIATCWGYPSSRATALVPSMTLPPPTLTRRSAAALSASAAAFSTEPPGVCWPMPAKVPACLPPSNASTRRMRSVFSFRLRPVMTKARSHDRVSTSSFSRAPTPKWTRVVARKVWVPLFTPPVYTCAPARMAAFSATRLLRPLGQLVHVARGAVVDHRYLDYQFCSSYDKWTRVHFKGRG